MFTYDITKDQGGRGIMADFPVSFHYVAGSEQIKFDSLLYFFQESDTEKNPGHIYNVPDDSNILDRIDLKAKLNPYYHFDITDRASIGLLNNRSAQISPECNKLFALLDANDDGQLSSSDFENLPKLDLSKAKSYDEYVYNILKLLVARFNHGLELYGGGIPEAARHAYLSMTADDDLDGNGIIRKQEFSDDCIRNKQAVDEQNKQE